MIAFWILFIIAFFGTYYSLPHSIRKLKDNNYLARDMYKKGIVEIPTNCGMILLFTSFLAIAITPLIIRILNLFFNLEVENIEFDEKSLAFLLVVSIYSIYGLVDDLVDIGRISKLLLPVTFSFPLISVLDVTEVFIPLVGDKSLDGVIWANVPTADAFLVVVIPVYVMVVTNLVNMHSGYNGLQTGTSIIILSTLAVKCWMSGVLLDVLYLGSFLGSMAVFFLFNRYPSKAFEGNIGSMFFGSIIGCVIVLQEFWWFGFFILIPHTINFLLWVVWLIMMKLEPKAYLLDDGSHNKFGFLREDSTIEVPNRLTLKWIPNYYFELNEGQSTLVMYAITLAFCIGGIILF
tara:strand:- start:5947 stop:6990 length:1044 start_codon:yes stop_codon:yes gene_type:complete